MLSRMMTNRLENDLEGMVQDCLDGKTGREVDFSSGAEKAKSWKFQYEQLVSQFDNIADYDARDIIPRFSEAFVQAAKKIAESNLSETAKYECLCRLSNMRKTMGIDRRAREINKGMTTWTT